MKLFRQLTRAWKHYHDYLRDEPSEIERLREDRDRWRRWHEDLQQQNALIRQVYHRSQEQLQELEYENLDLSAQVRRLCQLVDRLEKAKLNPQRPTKR